MMNTWTVHKGFPLVTVKRNGTQVTLSQEHFLLNAENRTEVLLRHKDCFLRLSSHQLSAHFLHSLIANDLVL